MEVILWKQKSRDKFIKKGDRNTAYFHRLVNAYRRNKIFENRSVGNVSLHPGHGLEEAIVDHFARRFMSSKWSRSIFPDFLNFNKISYVDQSRLEAEFSEDESIPGKFAKLFEAEISEVAHLKGPTGYVWRVGLKKTADGLSFQNGWKEFVEQCSLEPGNLLVFKHDGKFCFNVQIFDGSGCERDYSYSSVNSERLNSNEGHRVREKTQEFVEVLHFSSPYEVHNWTTSRKLESGNPLNPQMSFLAKSVPSNEKDVMGLPGKAEVKRTKKKKKNEEIVGGPQGQLSIVTTGENSWCPRWFLSNRRPVTDEEKARAVEAARAFKSTNPSFTIVLRASYVYKKCPLAIPTNFAKIYLPRESQSMTLRDSSGKTWPVRYTCKTYAGLGSGWVTFAWEHNLEEADVCVFELIRQAPMIVMEVVIFRVLEEVVPLSHINGSTPGTKRGRPAKGP